MGLIVLTFITVAFLSITQHSMATMDQVCSANQFILTNCLKLYTNLSTYDEAAKACNSLPISTYLATSIQYSHTVALRNLSSLSGKQSCSPDGASFSGIASWIYPTFDLYTSLVAGPYVSPLAVDWMVNGYDGSGNCIASTPCGWKRMDCNTKLNYICYLRSKPKCVSSSTVMTGYNQDMTPDFQYILVPNVQLILSPVLPENVFRIPAANELTTCMSLCKNDVDCFAMEWVQDVCYHRKVTCQIPTGTWATPVVAFNVTYKPLVDPLGSHLNDTSLAKMCTRKPTLFNHYIFYLYLQMNRKNCYAPALWKLYMRMGDYQFASDVDS